MNQHNQQDPGCRKLYRTYDSVSSINEQQESEGAGSDGIGGSGVKKRESAYLQISKI